LSRPLPLDERLERAAQLVIRCRIFFDLWFYFEEAKARPPTLHVTEYFGEFFRFEPHAHFVAFVVHMGGLFERRHGTINLQGLAKEMKAAELIPAQTAKEVDTLLEKAAPLVSKVTILRSNLFAHRSASLSYAAAFEKAQVTADQLRDLTEIALEIANRLLLARGLQDHSFNYLPRQEAEAMLEALKTLC
jgi:AbiU2